MINIKKIFLYGLVPALPVMQLVMSVWAAIFPLTWFNAGDSIGYSISTGIVYFAFFYYKYDGKHPFIYWVSSLGLISMNVFSWLASNIYKGDYGIVYDFGIFIVTFVVIVVVWILKLNQLKEYIRITPK